MTLAILDFAHSDKSPQLYIPNLIGGFCTRRRGGGTGDRGVLLAPERARARAGLGLIRGGLEGGVPGGAGLARGFGEKFASKLGGSNSGPNQVQIRSKSDFDPISTRFRPDFDPIWTRFGPDFDPISTWAKKGQKQGPDFDLGADPVFFQ